jgi:hypothetical protein
VTTCFLIVSNASEIKIIIRVFSKL